jgi:hypothetical protein
MSPVRSLLAALGVLVLAPAALARAQALGTEFQVNTATAYRQDQASVSADAAGNFAVVWRSNGYIHGQRFGATGAVRGAEFQVSSRSYTAYPAVAVAPDGRFMVVWSQSQSPADTDVFGQRFNADGTANGAEFQVNTYTTSYQQHPSVAVDGSGNFVVAWNSYYQDGSAWGIFGQRFNAAGAPVGAEFQVNTYTMNNQYNYQSSVAMAPDGRFVVVWTSTGQDGSSSGVFGQRFNSNGTRAGAEFQINTYVTSAQSGPTVAFTGGGNFVVAWSSSGQDGSSYGVFGQRFDSAGAAVGSEFQINTFTTSFQYGPSIAGGNDGSFVVAWSSFSQDGSSSGIFSQRFNPDGSRQGSEFQVNSYTTSAQYAPALAMDGNGNFVVAWQSYRQDGSDYGIFAQRYQGEAELTGDGKALDYTADMKADLLWYNRSTGQVYLWPMNGATPTAFSPVATVGDLNWRIVGQGDFNGDGKADLVWHNQSTGQVYVWFMNGATPTSFNPVATVADLDWRIVATADFNGDGMADLCWHNRSTGQVFIWLMNGATPISFNPVATVADLNWRIVVARDFTGDGKADLVWYNRSTGQVFLWTMNGATPTAFSPVATVADLNWRIVASGDYNGDGKADLMWHNRVTGGVYYWPMNGATPITYTPVALVPDLNWAIVAAGEFGADGKADLVWYNRSTGQVYLWQMNGAMPTVTSPVATVSDLNWGIVHTQ